MTNYIYAIKCNKGVAPELAKEAVRGQGEFSKVVKSEFDLMNEQFTKQKERETAFQEKGIAYAMAICVQT